MESVAHSELTGIAVVALAALLCGLALERLRQPAFVGYILAGVLLGPSGFALVENRAAANPEPGCSRRAWTSLAKMKKRH